MKIVGASLLGWSDTHGYGWNEEDKIEVPSATATSVRACGEGRPTGLEIAWWISVLCHGTTITPMTADRM